VGDDHLNPTMPEWWTLLNSEFRSKHNAARIGMFRVEGLGLLGLFRVQGPDSHARQLTCFCRVSPVSDSLGSKLAILRCGIRF